jgi:hypothetical protein
MLRSADDLKGFSIGASDGDTGQVEAFYFDVKDWTVRYIVVNAGGWFNPRKLLISPLAIDCVNSAGRTIETDRTRDEVNRSPRLSTPLSLHHEALGNTDYLKVAGLHSTKEIDRFHVATADDRAAGHVDDFIIDDATWTIDYVIVDSRNWWPGKKVAIPTRCLAWIDRLQRKVHVDLSGEDIRNSPEYDDSALMQREFEGRLQEYYRQRGDWNCRSLPDRLRSRSSQ